MCGIAGYIGKQEISQKRIDATLRLMKNRGPDHQAWRQLAAGKQNVYFLHSRLAIIDLDPRSNQPFTRGDVTTIFNGEIYNYREVKKQLQKLGHSFNTDSDTEALLAAYEEWGEAGVEKLEGMWAYALWDAKEQKLILSRDRFGEKPLYILETGDGFYFGSEIKFLRSLSARSLTVNQHQLKRYLVNGYKSLYKSGKTFYEEIKEVPLATFLVIQNGEKKWHRYWQPSFRQGFGGQGQMTQEEAVTSARAALLRSVDLRLRADVPIAFCLSGGVDSAALASIAAKEFGYTVATFSIIDQDPRYDESKNIAATVKDIGSNHTEIKLAAEKIGTLDRLRQLIAYHDGPVATITYFVHSLLSEAISAAGFKVAVSGSSADELFSGYFDHWMWYLVETRQEPTYAAARAGWEQYVRPIVRNPYLSQPDLYAKQPNLREHIYLDRQEFAGYLTKPFDEPFTERHFTDSLLRNRMLNELFYEATPVILHEDDLNSMMYSVENRSPYLDSNLFATAYSIPTQYLMHDGYNKYILRQAVAGILNDQVRLDRHKRGFNASIHSIVNFQDPAQQVELLAPSPVFDIIHRDKIAALMNQGNLPNSMSKFLFNFINAKLFLEQNA